MSDDDSSLGRRRVLAATAALAGVAGCTGDGGGDGGSDSGGGDGGGGGGGGGDGLYEGGDFTCADIGTASRTQYDVSGTGFLCQFEYPDVFDSVDELGSPATKLTFVKRFGGDEPYTEDGFLFKVSQSDVGLERSQVTTDGENVSELEFGDRTAYVGPTLGITDEQNRGRFTVDLPHEVDEGVRYFGVQFILSIALQVTEGNPDAPDDCAATIDETCRAIAESVTPNPDSAFDEVGEE